MNIKSQREDVLSYLKRYGSITSLKAIEKFGATRLSSIIYDLRGRGYPIISLLKKVKTRYGVTNIAVYTLLRSKNENGNGRKAVGRFAAKAKR